MTESLAVMEEIERDFEKIQESDIRRAQRNLGKIRPHEKPLGALHSEAVKKLWALAERYGAAATQAALDSAHKTDTEEQTNELARSGMRLSALDEAVRSLFWIQAQDDIGDAAWDRQDGFIGLRADWMLVYVPSPQSSLAGILSKMFPGQGE